MKTPAGAGDRRLRITLLVDRFGNRFGGAEAYGVELMRVLGQRHDVSVVARNCVRAAGDIAGRVGLVEPTPEVAQYFAAADIYTHPTLNDS